MIVVLALTLALFALMMAAMSVGLFRGRCLRGSCGGADIIGPDGESLLCATCPKRRESQARSLPLVDAAEGAAHPPS